MFRSVMWKRKFDSLLKAFLLAFFALYCLNGYTQNVSINDDGLAPDGSAGLDVRFTNKGFLAPRMLAATRLAISNPATGLLVYQTNLVSGFYYNSGTPGTPAWVLLNSNTSGWNLTGNAATTAGTNFLGTTDAIDFVIKTNNTERARFFSGGTVGIGTSTLAASAALEVNSSTKGLLIPQVALTGTNVAGPVTSPATSLLVYNTATVGGGFAVSPGYYYWTGAWTRMASGGTLTNQWTTNVNDIYTNTSGNVGIGANTFPAAEKLLVDAGASPNVMIGRSSVNGFIQLNIRNTNAGAAASTDVVATNNTAGETSYIDMGINSSGNTSTGVLGGNNTAYLHSSGSADLAIGNSTASRNLNFFTTTAGGVLTERMRILPTGFVGINNASPTQPLDVTGNLRFSGALMPNNNAGTIGEVLVSAGNGNAPIWLDANNYLGNLWAINGNTVGATGLIGTNDNNAFGIETNGTERVRIATTGSVGIGATTFPNSEKLLVDAGTSPNVIVGNSNLNGFIQLNIRNTNAGTAASTDVVATNNAAGETSYIDMGINSSGNTSTGVLGGNNTAYLHSSGSADLAIGNSTASRNLNFFTTTAGGVLTERVRILPTGQMGIGMTPLTTAGITLFVSGNVQAGGVTLTSDRRLKKNIKDLNYGLKDLLRLQPVTYNWIDTASTSQKQIGLIAQDAKTVIPEIVTGDESKEKLSINYTELIPVLINAIKEQQKQIDELKMLILKIKN
ncbi:MAG: tail fiber domain-containing protein [Pyrinomonadaceae bacterium]|nr:tail fiber domain-containing protein [Sphingobacteriaceae bacterium]